VMDDLVKWLGAVLDDLERLAKAATPGPWLAVTPAIPAPPAHLVSQQAGDDPLIFGEVGALADAQHIIHWDPARVLAEIEAKRAILDLYRTHDDRTSAALAAGLNPSHPDERRNAVWAVLRLLALPYRDRPGFRPEWAPEQ
jgi:hypothetical protein